MKVNYLNGMNTSASALSAYRQWMNSVSENLANAQTTRTPEGGPYQRKQVSFEAVAGDPEGQATRPAASSAAPVRTHPAHMTPSERSTGRTLQAPGVNVRIEPDTDTPFTKVYDPGHPDADAEGMVEYPNVNPVTEMVNLILASRAYEANVAALAADKRMQEMALSIGRQ